MVKSTYDTYDLFRILVPLKMKLTLLILVASVPFISFGHNYFFAFAEVEYNDLTQKFEATISATAHDVEKALDGAFVLDSVSAGVPSHTQAAESYLNERFSIFSGYDRTTFHVIGSEVQLNDVVFFYLESEKIDLHGMIEVDFNLLMKEYPDQQNKITLYFRGRTFTATFLQNERKQRIVLETI